MTERLNPPDHDERIMQARRRAGYELGDPNWAHVIVSAYLNPTEDAQRLQTELES